MSNQIWVWKSKGLESVTRSDSRSARRAVVCGENAGNSSVRCLAASAVMAMSPPDAPMMSIRRPRSGSAGMQHFQRLAEGCQRIATGDPGLSTEGIERSVRAGE